ncbi:MinD/ParA family ATP-binding protein [Methyloterricola oryzae]|uniref:MinD/ParA family ATP-binding protein n=1 Tax=Methyloterricola oryzae TaxID=1495050 RepID=UPI0005EBC784|nr:MinD/ParA family protein [Methyloterricola oryzae]
MARTISIHSFRGGTGKTNTTANLAALLGRAGKRVAVVDTDIQSPGIHVLFGLDESAVRHTLNDFLWGACDIREAAHDVSAVAGAAGPGAVYLVPSSTRSGDIARVLREGYSVEMLTDGFQAMIGDLALDVLLIDTHPGLNEETLLAIAISDVLLVIMRPDQQDYLGTGVTVEVARRLEVPRMLMVVNKTPEIFAPTEVKAKVEDAYGCPVVGVLPHSETMMQLASGGIFAVHHPDHPLSAIYAKISKALLD